MFGHDDTRSNQGATADEPADDGMLSMPAPDSGADTTAPTGTEPYTADEPSLTLPASAPQTAPEPPATPVDAGTDDLIGIKQEALQQLKPLVGHLNQTPEEKFRTTMMMIQAADDQSLIPEAYESAKAITDEKVRAQALLDVVNEINYFTTQSLKS